MNAGTGILNVQMEGPSKVAITCTEVDEGYEFSYTPMAAGEYLISAKYSNVSLAGMPTMAVVTGMLDFDNFTWTDFCYLYIFFLLRTHRHANYSCSHRYDQFVIFLTLGLLTLSIY